MEISDLKLGKVMSNDEIVGFFKCSNQGGMRRSYKINTLVLISDYTKSIYEDWWEKDVFYYTGMGLLGDQELVRQNKTLYQSQTNGIDIHLFERFKQKNYIYIGQMYLAGEPYTEYQMDTENNNRKVYIFPLKSKLVDFHIPTEVIDHFRHDRQNNVQKLSNDQLEKIALKVKPNRAERLCITQVYSRSIYLSEWVKRLARGICQLCLQQAPFNFKRCTIFGNSSYSVVITWG
ncbi:hypothetical protein [Commensalibacter communis]|uniref:hypothetical protein n=1 Tax=Commensalibacter communis TaxID=2972786 RepID=UPI002330BE9C|nr:hypothetical protein [Commensalibacter communis]